MPAVCLVLSLLIPFTLSAFLPKELCRRRLLGIFRLTHNLPNPKGFSVNDSISSDHSSECYATTQDAIHHIKTFGPGCFLPKTDIKNAF